MSHLENVEMLEELPIMQEQQDILEIKKEKKPRTEKQIEATKRMILAKMEKQEERLKEKQEREKREHEQVEKLKDKIISKGIKLKDKKKEKQILELVLNDNDDDDDEPEPEPERKPVLNKETKVSLKLPLTREGVIGETLGFPIKHREPLVAYSKGQIFEI